MNNDETMPGQSYGQGVLLFKLHVFCDGDTNTFRQRVGDDGKPIL